MNQYEVLKFLKKNEGRKFSTKELVNKLKISQNNLSIKLRAIHKCGFIKKENKCGSGFFYWYQSNIQ